MEYQPLAKLLSVVVTLFFVCLYDYLTSIVTKPSLFHLISLFFGIVFMILSALLSQPIIGLENQVKDSSRLVGWVSYFAIECYGSLMVALFWSFTNSIMNLEQAKGAYGLIITIAQFGAIAGSTVATHAVTIGVPQLFLIASVCILSITLAVKIYWIIFHHVPEVQVRVDGRRMTRSCPHLSLSPCLSSSSSCSLCSSSVPHHRISPRVSEESQEQTRRSTRC
jgi:ATP/ADP translocase